MYSNPMRPACSCLRPGRRLFTQALLAGGLASALPAQRFGFTDRGRIAPGKKADLVIFDPKTITDTATTKDPQSKPIGLTDVLINGVPVLRNSQLTGSHPGRVLKRLPS